MFKGAERMMRGARLVNQMLVIDPLDLDAAAGPAAVNSVAWMTPASASGRIAVLARLKLEQTSHRGGFVCS